MSKALDKSHLLFINLFHFSSTSLKCKGKLPRGKSISFLLAFLYFPPFTRRCLCLCLPVFHKSSLEMFVSCLRQNLYPVTGLLNKKQACCEKTWCMATLSSLTLSTSIMQAIDFSGEEIECIPSQGELDPLGNMQVHISCHATSAHWDYMWSESFSWRETILSFWFWSVSERDMPIAFRDFRSIKTRH